MTPPRAMVVLATLSLYAALATGCDKGTDGKGGTTPAPTKAVAAQAQTKQPEVPKPQAKQPEVQKAERKVVMGMKAIDLETLKAKADRYAPVKITYDASKLDDNRQKMLKHLLDAADILDGLFWRQASRDGRTIFDVLAKGGEDSYTKTLRRYVRINAGRFDRLDGFAPFIGDSSNPLGATFYPADMSKAELEKWVTTHPESKQAITDEFTIVRRDDVGGLKAIPYSEFYGKELKAAADALRAAAALAENASLKHFLETRAAAFESNDYYASDVAWMDLHDNLIEVTIGPYEVYEDRLFNYKAAFEAFITLNAPDAAAELQKIATYLPKMEMNLPIPDEHKNHKRGTESPIRVVDVIYTAGDTRAGVQTLAFNLPNDERVREAKGSKKVLLRNVSDAKFDKILKPIAEGILAKDQLPLLSRHAYFNHTLMHEMSHGLGPGNITTPDGRETSVNTELKELYSTIEEAKADTLGIYNTFFLIDQGLFPKDLEAQCAVTTLAGTFRSVRFGAKEAHGKANMILFNYLLKEGAYVYDEATGRFHVDLTKIRAAVSHLAHDILMAQALGDYAATKKLIDTYGTMPESMKKALARVAATPVDIEPIYAAEPR